MLSNCFNLNETEDDDEQLVSSAINELQCRISPLAVMSILNHYQRRPKNHAKQNVIGLLFGYKVLESNTIYVSDGIGVQVGFKTDENGVESIVANHDDAKTALQLYMKAHPMHRLVGWYRTGLDIDSNTALIHELILMKGLSSVSNQLARAYSAPLQDHEYVHVLVDTQLTNNELSIKAFGCLAVSDPLKADSTDSDTIFYRYKELNCSQYASESEQIGLDLMIESFPEGTALDSPALLMNDTNHLENVLQSLLQNLENAEQYTQKVLNGEEKPNQIIGWMIGDALTNVPQLSIKKFEQMLSNRLQDFLLIEYIEKMTKAQLNIADKINKVLPSTVPTDDFE